MILLGVGLVRDLQMEIAEEIVYFLDKWDMRYIYNYNEKILVHRM